MDEHDGGSSTGLVIGMIVGGVIVLVLVVVVFVGGFFFMARGVAPPPMGPPPMAVEIMEAEIPAKVDQLPNNDPAPKPPEPEEVRKTRERIIGNWRQGDAGDKRRTWLEFRENGTARWLWSTERKDSMEAMDDGWDLLEVAKDRVKVRFFAGMNKNLPYERNIRLEGEDRLVIEGPLTESNPYIIGKDGNATYQRQRTEKKP